MTYHLYPKSYDLDEFKEKIKLLVSYGDNINALLGNDDADPGYSPLDKFIYKNSSSCSYVYRGSANANQAKSCEISKQYYKVLKSYGARCNKKCDDEKYFK